MKNLISKGNLFSIKQVVQKYIMPIKEIVHKQITPLAFYLIVCVTSPYPILKLNIL